MLDRVAAERAISFGSFRLLPGRRLLSEGDKPIRLGSRAFDILIALIERPGEVLAKEELIARAWPGLVVEEGNLKFQVAALRRALGDGQGGHRYIATVSGRGYSFIAPVKPVEEPQPTASQPEPTRVRHNLPVQLTRLIGRAAVVDKFATLLPRHRLLSIVGPGGIGKTSVALAVGAALLDDYPGGVWLIDLTPLGDPRLVPSALAAVFGLETRSDNPIRDLILRLRDHRMLLLFDNCEHVIEAAASLVGTLLKETSTIHVLVTSREPLRVPGEHIHRLAALDSPAPSTRLGRAEALGFPAVQLFVERAMAKFDEFELTDKDALVVAGICRKLDGIPLAIELAAARVDTLGVRGIAAHLDDRFRLLTSGHRTAPPRHRTLRAAIDWSYKMLSAPERIVLCRLAVFAGGFMLDAAEAVAGCAAGEANLPDALEILDDLVAKSLVMAEIGDAIVTYRLPESIRAYALEELDANGEREPAARCHAEYIRDRLDQANTEAARRPAAEWQDTYRRCIDDLRLALDWSFSPGGDAAIGVALTVAALPLWATMSMMAECRRNAERALAVPDSVSDRDPQREMELYAALGMALTYTTRPAPEIAAAWTKALEIAEYLDDVRSRLRALLGLWVHHLNAGEYRLALARAHAFLDLTDPAAEDADLAVGDRMVGVALHYLGDQAGARRHVERHLAQPLLGPIEDGSTDLLRFLPNNRVGQTLLARILWLQGFPDQAAGAARRAVAEVEASGDALSLCYALAGALCPVALYNGDVAEAERSATQLLDTATELGLVGWIARGHCFQGIVAIMREDLAVGLPMLQGALAELQAMGAAPARPAFLAVLARGLGRAARFDEGLATIDQALQLCEQLEERWCLPEVLRNKGELELLAGMDAAVATAEDCFRRALDAARRDGTLSLELRAALSLARLYRDRGRRSEAHDLLVAVYDRFTEGFATADLRMAKSIIDVLA